jgi:hypothetical protein
MSDTKTTSDAAKFLAALDTKPTVLSEADAAKFLEEITKPAAKPQVLGPPTGYTDLLDDVTSEKVTEEARQPRKWNPLRPSASGHCGRKLAFEFMEYRGFAPTAGEIRKPAVQRLLNLGHSIEYHLLKHFSDYELFQIKYKQQVVTFFPLANGELIEGSVDFVLYCDKWKAIGDVKSKGDKFSSYMASKWDETTHQLQGMKTVVTLSETAFWVEDLSAFLEELNDPFFADNFYQLNGYANTDFMKERGIDHAFIIQYNKNDSRIREVRFKPCEKVFNEVREKFTAVQIAVDDHKDPSLVPRGANLGSIRCAFCPYQKACWGAAADARQDYFDTFPKRNWPKDTSRMGPAGDTLETLYATYKATQDRAYASEQIEAAICAKLDEAKIKKVRFSDGATYEMKLLKSPREHFVLRRSKV